jgi:hypothetical protein
MEPAALFCHLTSAASANSALLRFEQVMPFSLTGGWTPTSVVKKADFLILLS